MVKRTLIPSFDTSKQVRFKYQSLTLVILVTEDNIAD